MPHESLRDIARRLVANYRLKHGGSPCRLVPAEEQRLADSIAQGAAIAQQLPPAAPDDVAEMLADDPALQFDLTLTDKDARWLQACRIDPNG